MPEPQPLSEQEERRICAVCASDSPKGGEWDRCVCGADVCVECLDAHDLECEEKNP